jgi:hypothetical protein
MMAEPEIGVSGRGKTSNTLYMRSEEQSESILEAARKKGGRRTARRCRAKRKTCYSVLRTSPLALARAALRAFFAAAA